MCDLLREFAIATKKLFIPRPQSVKDISERLRSTSYQAFESDDVPAALQDGWMFACDLGRNRVLLRRGAA